MKEGIEEETESLISISEKSKTSKKKAKIEAKKPNESKKKVLYFTL
jgi:hypothetical protein